MHVILGGTGHVGSAVAHSLLAAGEPVTIVARDPAKAAALRAAGAEIAIVDVSDSDALRTVFRRGRRAFLLNPPADPAGDSDVVERATATAILTAINGSGLERIVAQSTYGAQPGDRIGDLSVLYEFERSLAAQPIPNAIIRAAYYMTNWDASLESARRDGAVRSLFPADFALPMVAPSDLGEAAARLLMGSTRETDIHYVEGPERYTVADVAAAFAKALKREISVEILPREAFVETFRALGFSQSSARSYARMTEATLDQGAPHPDIAERGTVTLEAYIDGLVGNHPA